MKTPNITRAQVIGKEGRLAVVENEYGEFTFLPERLIRGCNNIGTKIIVLTTEVAETKGVIVDFLEVNFN